MNKYRNPSRGRSVVSAASGTAKIAGTIIGERRMPFQDNCTAIVRPSARRSFLDYF
jgi:hypothetical protein